MDDGTATPHPDSPSVPASPVLEGAASRLPRWARDQRIAFLLVGGLNTTISLVVFAIVSRFLTVWAGDLALLVTQVVGIPIAFALHRSFVFRVTGHLVRDFGRFLLVNAIPITVNLAVLPVLTSIFHWPVLISQISFTAAWVVSSYFLHRNYSFRRSAHERTLPTTSATGGHG